MSPHHLPVCLGVQHVSTSMEHQSLAALLLFIHASVTLDKHQAVSTLIDNITLY